MSAPSESPWLEAALWVCGTVVSASVGLWKFIASKASKKELADAVESMKELTAAIRERSDEQYELGTAHRERLYDKLDKFTDTIDKKFEALNKDVGATMIALSSIQGRLNERDSQR